MPSYQVLLSPAIGFAITTLVATWLNILGAPVRSFGYALMATLLLGAVLAVIIRKPRVAWRQLAPFLFIEVAALLLVGRPLFEFGTDWLSYSNDDMANYCLEAQRQMDHGFAAVPNTFDWVHLRDASLYYWSSYAVANQRQGSDVLLALVASVTRLNPLQAFMPVIVAFHLMLISSGCALAFSVATVRRKAAVIAGVLLATSALVALGTMAQLFAQVSGLGLLVASASAIVFALRVRKLGLTIIAATLAAGTAVVYPEIFPFLVLGSGVFVVANLFRYKRVPRRLDATVVILLFCTIVLVNVAWRTFVFTLLPQITHGTNTVGQFWYFLVPSGPANLFGFLAIGTPPDALGLDAFIIVGHLALAAWLFFVVRSALRGEVVGVFAAIMALFGLELFARHADFGLFKLAMFVQPFLMGVIAVAYGRLLAKRSRLALSVRVLALTLLAVFLIGNFVVQQLYVERSRSIMSEFHTNSFAELPYASSSRLLSEFADIRGLTAYGDRFVSDTMNFTLAKIEAEFIRGNQAVFVSEDFFFNIAGVPATGYEIPRLRLIDERLNRERAKVLVPHNFVSRAADGRALVDKFAGDSRYAAAVKSPYTWLIESSMQQSVLNRLNPDSALYKPAIVPIGGVRDHLVFIDSSLGRNYRQTLGLLDTPAGLFPPEPDNGFGDGKTMAGIGRYALLMVLGAEANLRLELSFTVTSKGQSILPQPTVYGLRPARFHIVGRGSARVISDPVEPMIIGGARYLLLDMGAPATAFPDRRKGLMNLYGRDIAIDRRKTTAFVRDISVLTASQLAKMQPPASIARFPADLRNPNLEYSGLYEDGWSSESSFVTLGRSGQRAIELNGLIPRINGDQFATPMTVSVDKRVIVRLQMRVGYFHLRFPLPSWVTDGKHTVKVTYDHGQVLPRGDGRVVGAQIKAFGFAP